MIRKILRKRHASKKISPSLEKFIDRIDGILFDTGHVCMACLRPIWQQHETAMIGKGHYHLSCATRRHKLRAKSDIFHKCKACGKIAIYGVCPSCGFGVACMGCWKVRQGDDSWRIALSPIVVSHGICPDCLKQHHPKIYTKLQQIIQIAAETGISVEEIEAAL